MFSDVMIWIKVICQVQCRLCSINSICAKSLHLCILWAAIKISFGLIPRFQRERERKKLTMLRQGTKGHCNFHTKFLHVKNKYLTLCQSCLHTASETFVRHKKFGSGSIFCIFASVASILIGKDDEYEKMHTEMSDSVCNDLNNERKWANFFYKDVKREKKSL